MKPFYYSKAASLNDALGQPSGTVLLAGGTTLIDLMKLNVIEPDRVVDITGLGLAGIEDLPDGGLRLGALASNTAVAEHPRVIEEYRVLSQSILAGASVQLRNAATVAGNLLQRTRCYYYRDRSFACNKRSPGTGCSAVTGINRSHGILGVSEYCISVNPSDMAVGLLVLDAHVNIATPNGSRSVSLDSFYLAPDSSSDRENVLENGELITSIDIPATPRARHSAYIKVRDRTSYAFALVSAAAAVELSDGVIVSARLGLGGVSYRPWRPAAAERLLIGREPSAAAFEEAGDAAIVSARTYSHNSFKPALARTTLIAALHRAARGGANDPNR